MNWKSKFIPLGILLASILVAAIIFLTRPQVEQTPPEIPKKLVRVQVVKKEMTHFPIKSQGSVAPRTEIMLVSEVAGRVIRTAPAFAAGGFFQKGNTLLTIDPSNYELALTQAKSQVAQAERMLQMETEQGRIAREEWQRLNQGDIPPLVARTPQMNEAQALLDAAKASLKKAELDLQRTRISAPFMGRVRAKNADVGQYVAPGSVLGAVYAIDYAEVRLPIPDDALAYLDMPYNFQSMQNKKGPKVLLSAQFAGKVQEWEGYLTRVEGEIDPKSRMIYVVARVADPYGVNKPKNHVPLTVGLFVEAEIQGKAIADVTAIPRSALRDNNQVILIDEADKVQFRTVEVLRQEGDLAYIQGGLSDGEQVCISQISVAVEGMTVAVVREGETQSVVNSGNQEGRK